MREQEHISLTLLSQWYLELVVITTSLSAPDSAPHTSPGLRPSQDLSYISFRTWKDKHLKCFIRWVKAHHRICLLENKEIGSDIRLTIGKDIMLIGELWR